MLVPGKSTRCRLVIADRHPIVLQGLMSTFSAQPDFEVVASCSSGKSCVAAVRKLVPDVALIADTLPDLTISEILAIAQAESLSTQLVIFTDSEKDADLVAAVASGACSAISKDASPDALLRSLRPKAERIGASLEQSPDLAPNGKEVESAKLEKMIAMLTDRERDVMRLVSQGLSNKEIAQQLKVSPGTVKVHLYNIFQKLEINNRTVLAAIALQRPLGFGTLSLAALAFATMSDVKASEANNAFLDGDGTAYKDLERGVFELWSKLEVLRRLAIEDPAATPVLPQKNSSMIASQIGHSAARMEELPGLSNFGKGYGATGSSTPPLLFSPRKQSDRDYGIFTATAAGVWAYTLDNANAHVQAFDLSQMLNDTFTLAVLDRTTHATTVTIHRASDSVSAPGLHNVCAVDVVSGSSGNDTIKGNGGQDTIHGGPGSDTIKFNATIIGGYGGDQLTGRKGDEVFAYSSTIDSNSARLDTIASFASRSDKINLAAFGALAFLHLSSTSTTVPPHTLAWIFNSARNETIVYVNPTDRSLHIGDKGLLEIHLLGVVSVAESDFVHGPAAGVVAAAMEGIDPALLVTTASDGSVLTTEIVEASVEATASNNTAIWTMPADDGLRFHFGGDRIGTIGSVKLASFDDSAFSTNESDDGAGTAPVHVLSIESSHSDATALTEERFLFNEEPTQASGSGVQIGHGKSHGIDALAPVDPGVIAASAADAPAANPGVSPGNSAGHGNSQHAPHSAAATTSTAELSDPSVSPGNSAGHGNSQHAPHSGAATTSTAELSDPGVSPGNSAGHGNSQHAPHSGAATTSTAELIDPGVSPGNSAGHGNSQHAPHSGAATTSTAELIDPAVSPGNSAGHGNSQHAPHSAAATTSTAELIDPALSPGNSAGHGNSQQAPHSAAAKALAVSEAVEPSAEKGADHQEAFHFKNEIAASNHAAAVNLEDAPISFAHGAGELAAILEIVTTPMSPAEEHAASHVNSGLHDAVGHGQHDLLI